MRSAKSCHKAPARGSDRDRSRQTERRAERLRKSPAAPLAPCRRHPSPRGDRPCVDRGPAVQRPDPTCPCRVCRRSPRGHSCPSVKEAGEVWFVPIILYIRYETGNQNQIDRTFAKCLIGDMNIAALGILGNRLHGRLHRLAGISPGLEAFVWYSISLRPSPLKFASAPSG